MNTPQRIENCLVCVDVDYRDDGARAALCAFADWRDGAPIDERVAIVTDVAPYEPGAFYKRELPCILRVLDGISPRAIVIDGYVWLGTGHPGLGARLYDAIDRRVPVIGVAKTSYAGADAIAVLRGDSVRPLYVTAAGVEAEDAAKHVESMHGAHRIPTLLRRVDRLCRTHGAMA